MKVDEKLEQMSHDWLHLTMIFLSNGIPKEDLIQGIEKISTVEAGDVEKIESLLKEFGSKVKPMAAQSVKDLETMKHFVNRFAAGVLSFVALGFEIMLVFDFFAHKNPSTIFAILAIALLMLAIKLLPKTGVKNEKPFGN